MVRIRFPPGESPQTIGSAGDFTGSRSPRRSSGSARRSRASMRSARSLPASSGSWRRLSVCWHATSKAGRQKKGGFSQDPDHRNEGDCSSAAARAHYARDTSWWQARLADPRRAGPCFGRRQDAAGNHGCMQGGAPEPCRRRHCPAQASWPHRTARREALRHAVGEVGATRRGLILQGIKNSAARLRKEPTITT
jgi:hypothetical protein